MSEAHHHLETLISCLCIGIKLLAIRAIINSLNLLVFTCVYLLLTNKNTETKTRSIFGHATGNPTHASILPCAVCMILKSRPFTTDHII